MVTPYQEKNLSSVDDIICHRDNGNNDTKKNCKFSLVYILQVEKQSMHANIGVPFLIFSFKMIQ